MLDIQPILSTLPQTHVLQASTQSTQTPPPAATSALATTSALFERIENRAPLRSHVFTVLKLIGNHFLAAIQLIFYSETRMQKQEQVQAAHYDIYTKEFNKGDNGAVFLPATFSMLEENGNWNEPMRPGGATCFKRAIDKFKEDNPGIIPDNYDIRDTSQLREAFLAKNKKVLAFPINLDTGGGRHWTVMHFNFETKKISYIDSINPNAQAERVNERLDQALAWMNSNGDSGWEIDRPDDRAQPSALAECKQKDFWNCGIFTMYFTALVGQGRTPAQIDAIPFNEVYRHIAGLRLEVMDHVNGHFDQMNNPLNADHQTNPDDETLIQGARQNGHYQQIPA